MAKILVADDNSNIQKMVGLALKDQGIDVVAVGNGEAAVRKISDVRPDLVLADVFMPVRNGYEVCRYVKEDSSLSHIPVILLVGAFDPLDEQEAQRVGADGVLKKPFVPPDPLISMVKSALTRAGVPIGPPQVAEKPTAVPGRSAAELAGGAVASKLPAFGAEPLPQASSEPAEEIPAAPSRVQIPEGQGPLAFGNLLGSTETEEEPAFSSKPMINIAGKHNWDEEQSDEPEEEEEGEQLTHGWRPSAMDEEIERAASSSTSAPDWRDEAFHGSSPAKDQTSAPWAAAEKTTMVEAAESQSVAVSTLETKPAEASSPFASDAWAAAMAAGVEDKIADAESHAPEVKSQREPATPASQPAFDELAKSLAAPPVSAPPEPKPAADVAAPAPVFEEAKIAEPGNWALVPEASWEAEAKRASLLASTWDAAPARSPEETQEVAAYTSEQASAHSEAPGEQTPSAYSGHFGDEHEAHAASPAIEEPPTSAGALPKAWENTWESPASPIVHRAEPEPDPANGTEVVAAAEHAPVASSSSADAEATQAEAPNMDELVARVLGKMNPDVLQKVTREILKPVIEAIVRDELSSKK